MASGEFSTEASIADWIEHCKGEGVVRIDLKASGAPGHIKRVALAANADTGKLAEALLARARSRGLTMQCVRALFLLHAFAGETGEHVDEEPIVVPGANAGKGESSEEGTAQERLVSNLLRGNLELHRLLVSSRDGAQGASERLINQLSAALDGHEKRRIAVLDLHERLVDGHERRELAQKAYLLEEKRQDMLEKKIDLLVPIVFNRLMGGGPGKGTPYLGEEMVRQFLGSLQPEVVEKIMAGLPAEQTALFSELYLAYAAAEEKRKVNAGAPKAEGGTNGAINAEPGKRPAS
jgi:hypothetical protein